MSGGSTLSKWAINIVAPCTRNLTASTINVFKYFSLRIWTSFAEPFRCQQLEARRGGMRSVLRKELVDFLSLVTWELVPFVQGFSNCARPKLVYALFFCR